MLRDLSANRCPECGRAFDPNDPRTMSVGRPLRAWQRKLLKPIGWPVVLLAVLGTTGLLYLSNRLHLQPEPWQVFRDELRWPTQIPGPLTTPDWVFFVSAGLWIVFLALFTGRQLARLLVPRVARRAFHARPAVRRRRMALELALIVSITSMAFGWQQRIGRRWMARVLVERPRVSLNWGFEYPIDASGNPLFQLTAAQGALVIGNFVSDGPTAPQRQAALKILIESSGKAALPALLRAAGRENNPQLLATELRLIGLIRDPSTADFLIARLQDSRSEVRAAAADAVGILRHPSYSIALPGGFWIAPPTALLAPSPINLANLLSPAHENPSAWQSDAQHELLDDPPIAVDAAVRPILQRMMLQGASASEREAAARALVIWPPANYQLRVAEWGVWIDNNAHLALAKSILDEIPPFVHRTGNRTGSFGDYFLYPSAVFKPIVHLTSNLPLAADVEVHIRQGRPWFAYPKPDDFAMETSGTDEQTEPINPLAWRNPSPPSTQPDEFVNPPIKPLPDCREGYPWLLPGHRRHESDWQDGALIYSLGLRWQSLIIAPTQLPWMTPPTVPADAKFAWWSRLRQVPSSWLANRGEAERFLYYDGPTRSKIPMAVSLDGTQLRFAAEPVEKGDNSRDRSKPPVQNQFEPMPARQIPGLPEYEGMYIDCRGEGLSAIHMVVDAKTSADVTGELPLKGEAVIQRFRQMLLAYGLTPGEAEGLVATWTPQFFHTPGRRFVLRMSPADYARQCPMQVRPTPTQVVRLGLILTEFDAKPVAARQPQKE
jgi:hypothetical protein